MIRAIKGNLADYAQSGPSDSLIITVWDAAYSRRNLKRTVLRDRGPEQPPPGEMAVSAGERWRIYALSQVGNWTAKTCLGSHSLEASEPARAATSLSVP